MFVSSRKPSFNAIFRKCMYSFICELSQSENAVLMALMVRAQSDSKETLQV